jgi:hypothetical protein
LSVEDRNGSQRRFRRVSSFIARHPATGPRAGLAQPAPRDPPIRNLNLLDAMLRPLHRALPLLASLLFVAPAPLAAQEPIDLAAVSAIRDEGLNRSQAVEHLVWLADVYGPRLTGGEGIRQAADWAKKQFAEWGLQNIHEEPFAFGAGWMLDRFSAHMIAPQVMPIIGMPKSWTAGTDGPVEADVVLAPIDDEADFARYRGKLRGKIVLTQPARAVRMLEGRLVLRMTEDEIEEAQSTPVRAPRAAGGAGSGGGASPFARARDLQRRAQEFYRTEGVVALVDRCSDSDESAGGSDLSWRAQRVDGGTIFVGSGGPRTGDQVGKELPSITIAVEQYNRMVRILERDVPVRMELDVRVRFLPETEPRGFNLIAEIPGTDPALKDEVVMLGAHFDSHHGSTGATDNATGSAAMMEAMRIIKATGLQPRRTIRLALWGAEEQGLIGSRQYVRQHFADPETMRTTPEWERLSAYYNLDNGTGKIRGIWMQENSALAPVFRSFMQPLHDLGVEILGPRSVGSTDHAAFDAVGLPGFQFMQERLEYNSRTHHSNMDYVDRVQTADLVQQATVAAVFAWLTADRDSLMPRQPVVRR